MNDNLKCILCSKRYVTPYCGGSECTSVADCESRKIPLLLVCGHAFCHYCLVDIYERKSEIVCPTCGIHTQCLYDKNVKKLSLSPHLCAVGYVASQSMKCLEKLDVIMQGIPKNKILQRSAAGQCCCECMQHTATVTCVQCGVDICDECFKTIHQYSRVLQQHQAIPVTRSASNVASVDCKKHHSPTSYFCVTDETLICKDCISHDHNNHQVRTKHKRNNF